MSCIQLPKRKNRRRLGATAVEMALVTPLFLLLVFGLVEFSRMVMVKQALTNAAREGCRKAILATTQSNAAVDSQIRSDLAASIPNSGDIGICRIEITPRDLTTAASGSEVTTKVEVDYANVSWFTASFLGNVKLDGKATMVRE